MLEPEDAVQTFVAWADIPSAFLLAASIALGGLTPVRPLWGRSNLHNFIFTSIMLLQTFYTIARFIIEGIYQESGPREFMASSVVYTTRWIFLWAYITFNNTIHGRLFQVARELRRVKLLRHGKSTHADWRGEQELVLRRGVRDAGPGIVYWRGIIENAPRVHETRLVYLKQSALHSEILDVIGTTEFRQNKSFHKDESYKLFYNVVMTACTPNISVDFGQFIERWPLVQVSRFAERLGADNPSDLGGVARRIAGDGTYYADNRNGEMRTREQVAVLNSCIQDAFERIRDGGPVLDAKDVV